MTSPAQALQEDLALSDDEHPTWAGKRAVWIRGFRGGVRLARQGKTLDGAGFMLNPASELHQGMVDGWRVADGERATPMGHRFNEGLWGPDPSAAGDA